MELFLVACIAFVCGAAGARGVIGFRVQAGMRELEALMRKLADVYAAAARVQEAYVAFAKAGDEEADAAIEALHEAMKHQAKALDAAVSLVRSRKRDKEVLA